ncbi:hypothetical protein [Flindersiella endophytica]
MTETSARTAPVDRSRVVRRGLATIAGWYAGLIVAYVVALLLSPDEKTDGSCDGIGWGCTPNPRDSLLLVGIVVGIPFALGSLAIAAGAFALTVRRFRSGVAAGTVAVWTGFLLAAAVPLVVSLF